MGLDLLYLCLGRGGKDSSFRITKLFKSFVEGALEGRSMNFELCKVL